MSDWSAAGGVLCLPFFVISRRGVRSTRIAHGLDLWFVRIKANEHPLAMGEWNMEVSE